MNELDLNLVVRGVLAQIAPEAAGEELDAEVELVEQLDLDSMDFLNFVIGLHEATGIDIPERDYPQLTTLAGCVEYLRLHSTH
ncbi:MAG TPA: phosphopantetheine-binding protein [Acidimicrobiia bacterium]